MNARNLLLPLGNAAHFLCACAVIPEVASKEQIDLIVMGTVARVGLEGYFIGNTAETVLDRVACSVLTIKPEGFSSPVKLD